MSAACCRSLAGRCAGTAKWAVPASALALLPKCPACVAAYVAAATGLGISAAAAAALRTTVLVVCVVSLIAVAVKAFRTRPQQRRSE